MGHLPSAKPTKTMARVLGMGGTLSASSRVLIDSIYHIHGSANERSIVDLIEFTNQWTSLAINVLFIERTISWRETVAMREANTMVPAVSIRDLP